MVGGGGGAGGRGAGAAITSTLAGGTGIFIIVKETIERRRAIERREDMKRYNNRMKKEKERYGRNRTRVFVGFPLLQETFFHFIHFV